MKANWSCTACGMYSGRRYCVQRHIENIHKGKANAIPFVEYLVGRRRGSYPPKGRPSFGSKKRTIVEKTQDEFIIMCIRRAVETYLPPVGNDVYRFLMERAFSDKVRQYTEETIRSIGSEPNAPPIHRTTSKGGTQDEPLHNDFDLDYNKMIEIFKQCQGKVKLRSERLLNSDAST